MLHNDGAINSLKSQLSSSDEQGQVLGAVSAIQSLGSGSGPFVFSWLFGCMLLVGSPTIVWWVAAALTFLSVILAVTVPNHRKEITL